MTREEAIEAVKTAFGMWECEFDCFGEDWTNEHKARDMAIEALQEQKTGKWIPCSERLPEEGNTTYLTTVDYGEFGGGVGQRFFYGKNIGWEDDAVIAWMPLPSPYKGDES